MTAFDTAPALTVELLSTELLANAEELFQAGNHQEAGSLFELAAECRSAFAYFRLGLIAYAGNRADEAIDWVRSAIDIDPGNAEYHYTLGRAYKQRQEPIAAELAYREAVRLRPDYLDAWVSLGVLMRNLDRPAEAAACQHEALRIDPNNFHATLNLGNALLSDKRHQEAVIWFRRAIERNPDSAEAHNNLGRALLELRDENAADHFRHALTINPSYFDAAEGLGMARLGGSYQTAVAALAIACDLRPDAANCRLLLATSYMTTGQLDEAGAEFERLLRAHPTFARAKAGLASVLAFRGQYTKPRALFEDALGLQPDDPIVNWQYSLFLLRSGDFSRAWDCYEARTQLASKDDAYDRALGRPRWKGEPLTGKTLLITREQGLGDEITFASVFPEIVREAAHCILECDERLESLFRRTFRDATICGVKVGKNCSRELESSLLTLPPFDYWTPAGTLPRYRRRAAEDFPKHRGYLMAAAERTNNWSARLRELGPGLKVGISWRGGTAATNSNRRSCSLQTLAPILATKGVHFVNLQYGNCVDEINSFTAATGIAVHTWQEALEDYDETAALVAGLDLVISVCTAIVHLGGALGRPVWVMAPFVAEWRYGREGPAMIWYPSVRMFRQPRFDAWSPVIADVKRALGKVSNGEALN